MLVWINTESYRIRTMLHKGDKLLTFMLHKKKMNHWHSCRRKENCLTTGKTIEKLQKNKKIHTNHQSHYFSV